MRRHLADDPTTEETAKMNRAAAAGGLPAGPAGLSSDAAIAGGRPAAKAALSAPQAAAA